MVHCPVAFGPVAKQQIIVRAGVRSRSSTHGNQEIREKEDVPFKAILLVTYFPSSWPHFLKLPPLPNDTTDW
jgi:hypothetical protein